MAAMPDTVRASLASAARRVLDLLTGLPLLGKRQPLAVASALCVLVVLLSIGLAVRDGTVVVTLRWYHLPLLVAPAVWVLRHNNRRFEEQRRAERRRAGLCERCGYDLTGNVSGVCPECGKNTRPQ